MILNSSDLIRKVPEINGVAMETEDDILRELRRGNTECEDAILKATSEYRLKLGEHMKLDHVLFLFGNGASIYAGSKDTKDFDISRIIQDPLYKDIYDVLNSVEGLGMEEQLNRLITIRAFFNITQNESEQLVAQLIDDIKKTTNREFCQFD